MERHVALLGWKVRDKVTGFTGTVTHVGIDLYGCVQAIVHPPVITEKGGEQKTGDSHWFDVARLERMGKAPVMRPVPVKGDAVVAGADLYKPVK
jgi:hypothetical protein